MSCTFSYMLCGVILNWILPEKRRESFHLTYWGIVAGVLASSFVADVYSQSAFNPHNGSTTYLQVASLTVGFLLYEYLMHGGD
jgi:hypothetical protein